MNDQIVPQSSDSSHREAGKARVVDGRVLATLLQGHIQERVAAVKLKCNRAPGLGVILVGDNPASRSYITMKERYARACGLEAFDVHLPENSSEEQLLEAIDTYNNDPRVDGILLQLPIPKHLNTNRMLDRISPQKDADGLHPLNQGHMIRGSGSLLPCTPQGALRLLDLALTYAQGVEPARYDEIREFDLSGKRAVVIGRSILVGKPLALLLQQRNATVTMAHSKTLDLADEVSRADYVFAAAGSPKLIKGDWLRQHQIVIDVGTNRLPSGALCGDVDFVAASQIVAAITPVPGGVGPMTVANLVLNTLTACERSLR